MSDKVLLLLNLILLTSGLVSCKDKKEEKPEMADEIRQRVLMFSGYEWIAEGYGDNKINPGQNYFSCSEENVWIDKKGNLHLRITKRGDKWYCAKLTLKESHSYNKYVFTLGSRVDKLDRNVVGGLFTYLDDSNEIDIEFSKWGIKNNPDGQFIVQPAHKEGNSYRFKLKPGGKYSTHIIDWEKDKIDFKSYRGTYTENPKKRKIMSEWSYTGEDIPGEDDERVIINLWLYNGMAPSNNKEAEMILSSFRIL
ncbi:MAG TPA: glycoside hydrolase family 16 protein [Bacteroidales bacterium]|jgi:hypothetical protein|nr:hypothetical protein [Bacteroidales bacterium]OQB60502.1 MAG: hypothetical protein BWX96_02150 [Bacteroidetes bacterium ADurb.Bin145]HOU03023.1 glycoside hydrolase family 16 protein [Bacteroidales bacterium]HQG63425.1 glycoside hydrolase family 16 protein [Bacteroidales bacterium]HQK69097.1 glycoside hydrolase family 16 protein [Bacteroidales bacterium]